MQQIRNLISDRGSRYAVSFGAVSSASDIAAFLKELKSASKFAKATHNSWAVLLKDGGARKDDDGEGGAGAAILRMLEREELYDRIIVVTRWYGGVHLGGDRFRHVTTATRAALEAMRAEKA